MYLGFLRLLTTNRNNFTQTLTSEVFVNSLHFNKILPSKSLHHCLNKIHGLSVFYLTKVFSNIPGILEYR